MCGVRDFEHCSLSMSGGFENFSQLPDSAVLDDFSSEEELKVLQIPKCPPRALPFHRPAGGQRKTTLRLSSTLAGRCAHYPLALKTVETLASDLYSPPKTIQNSFLHQRTRKTIKQHALRLCEIWLRRPPGPGGDIDGGGKLGFGATDRSLVEMAVLKANR